MTASFIEFTNDGTKVTKPTGCFTCKHLEYIEDTSYETLDGGWSCQWRDSDETDKFKHFPCKRKLKCWESQIDEVKEE